MDTLLAQASDDQLALTICGAAVLLSAAVMYLTPVVGRMTGQIRLHEPQQQPEWSAGQMPTLINSDIPAQEKAA